MSLLTRPVRIAVIDDQDAFRDAVRGLVEHVASLAWAGSAPDGSDVVGLVDGGAVDLLLLDVNLPGRDGTEVARELHEAGSSVVVVLCSTYDVCDLPESVRTCGARAYLRKEELSGSVLLDVWEHRPTMVEYLDETS
jgi:DNA-binding NarL/FixJ family response regulator